MGQVECKILFLPWPAMGHRRQGVGDGGQWIEDSGWGQGIVDFGYTDGMGVVSRHVSLW